MLRQPAVAGQFYPGQEKPLRSMVEEFLATPQEALSAIGVVSPHAGYVYSGAIAGETFGSVNVPDTVVVLGPNHHGYGQTAALFPEGKWATPLGEVPIEGGLAQKCLQACPELQDDELAHRFEHSLEVQVPFLQVKNPQVSIVPICLGYESLDPLLSLGKGLGGVLKGEGRDVLVVASSDMTHYEAGDLARKKDLMAIEHILALDPEELFRTVRNERISMCGVIPVVVMLAAAKEMGATKAELIRYGNSGDVTGDQSEVVGYAGLRVR